MLSKIMALSPLLALLMACKPAQSTPITPTVQIVIPTPPPIVNNNVPRLPILLPNEANQWITYRDGLSDFGLALPQQWHISPPDPHAVHTTLTVTNFDPTFIDAACTWPNNLAQMALTSWQVASEQSTLEWIGAVRVEVQSLEAIVNGRYAGYLLTIDQQQELILRLTANLILQIQVVPNAAWQLSDVQNILNSLAAPTENIDLPAARPTAPLAVPGFCRDAAPLYAGPGVHFEQVGLLLDNDSLPVIDHSHDGRWLKLLYPNASNHTAWVSLTEAISTAGKPPIQAIQIQPGNS